MKFRYYLFPVAFPFLNKVFKWASYTMIALMQTGVELILNSSNEEFLVAMFFSLSKLSFVSTQLITEQVIASWSLLFA